MVVLFLIFWGASMLLFYTVAAPIYIPINSAQGFSVPYIFTLSGYFNVSSGSP